MDILSSRKTAPLKGNIEIPADKSISHRSIMFSLISEGTAKICNFSKGADCHSTLKIVQQLGVETKFLDEKTLIVTSKQPLVSPTRELDCGNSGTTMRLMSGILAGQSFKSTLIGDQSLSKRPMKRVIEPLELMGAKINHNDFRAPLHFDERTLQSIEYNSKLSSAQVKSCILLAGLKADGTTTFTEPHKSRNHTELMLKYLGANLEEDGTTVKISPSKLEYKDITVAGDISSAAFFLVAGAIVPGSDITIKNVGLNPTRDGIMEILQKMGADLEILNLQDISGEPVGDVRIKHSDLKSTTIEGAIIPRLIDELPVIAVLASQADGQTIVKDASDLRNKEADRIKCLVNELTKIGVDITETEDGFIINGKTALKGGTEVECYHDHRLAMSFYVAGLVAKGPVKINEFQWVDISFPEFLNLMAKIGG